MNADDRAEVKSILTDVLAGPLEKINGKLHVMVQQLGSVEAQVLKTNGHVTDHEVRIRTLEIEEVRPEIHTILECAQTKIIEQNTLDINTLKTAKSTEGNFMTIVRSNVTLFIIGAGLLINIIIGLSNHRQNANGLENQASLKDQIKGILREDSTYIHNQQFINK